MLMNSLEHLLIPADSRDEVQQTLTEKWGEKNPHQSWQNCSKMVKK